MNDDTDSMVRERQEPLRKRYREAPDEAWIEDHAKAVSVARIPSIVPSSPATATERYGSLGSTVRSVAIMICPIQATFCARRSLHAWIRRCA